MAEDERVTLTERQREILRLADYCRSIRDTDPAWRYIRAEERLLAAARGKD